MMLVGCCSSYCTIACFSRVQFTIALGSLYVLLEHFFIKNLAEPSRVITIYIIINKSLLDSMIAFGVLAFRLPLYTPATSPKELDAAAENIPSTTLLSSALPSSAFLETTTGAASTMTNNSVSSLTGGIRKAPKCLPGTMPAFTNEPVCQSPIRYIAAVPSTK